MSAPNSVPPVDLCTACCCLVVVAPAITFGAGAAWGALSGSAVLLSGTVVTVSTVALFIIMGITNQLSSKCSPYVAQLINGTVFAVCITASVAAGVYFGIYGIAGIAIFGGIGGLMSLLICCQTQKASSASSSASSHATVLPTGTSTAPTATTVTATDAPTTVASPA